MSIFSVMLGRSHPFLCIMQYSRELVCLAQGHNAVTLLWIERRTSRFIVYYQAIRGVPYFPIIILFSLFALRYTSFFLISILPIFDNRLFKRKKKQQLII